MRTASELWMIRLLGTIFLYLLTSIPVKGQPYYFRHYQVENGLSNNTVFCSTQDSNGFMWFGTKDGLNRFDGYHFKIFRAANRKKELNADYIFSLLPGRDGMIWVGSATGLYRFSSAKERFEPVLDSVKNITSIQADQQGRLWFLSGQTTCRYNPHTGQFTKFPVQQYFGATSLCIANDGSLWAATNNGFIQQFDEATGRFTGYDVFAHSAPAASRRIEKIKAGNGQSIYIGTKSQGIKLFYTDRGTYSDVLTQSFPNSTIFVRDILRQSDNEYWFATEQGIFIINTATGARTQLQKELTNPYSINDNAVYTLCKDTEGSTWAGTYFGGINYYSQQGVAFRKYFPGNTSSPISGNAVRDICTDDKGNLWVGTEDNGITRINPQTGSSAQYLATGEKGSISYPNVHGLLAEKDNLWIGTYEHGIDVLDMRTGRVKQRYMAGDRGMKSNFALCFLQTKAGKILVGTSGGVYSFDAEKQYFDHLPVVPRSIYVKCLLETRDNIIWAGTGKRGVLWYNPHTNQYGQLPDYAGADNTISDKSINDLYEDDHNNLWIATEGAGLCQIDLAGKTATWYTSESKGIPSNYVYKILQDNDNKIWISTSKGLASVDPAGGNSRVYTQANGLLSDQFNYHSGCKAADGTLYFGSVKGLVSFHPSQLVSRPFVAPVYITGFQVHDRELTVDNDSALHQRSITYTDRITLSHEQSGISIDVAALSYVSPEMTTYSYRMVGLNNEWRQVSNSRKAYFTNLSPGKYVFEVKAGSNGAWNDHIRRLTILVTPPFWMTGWAILLYVVLGILIVYYLFRSYHKRQQNKKEKEIYKSKIEFFTNVAHEIRTPLTLIKGPVENLLEMENELPRIKEDVACLNRNTKRLMDLVTQVLDFRQIEINSYSLDFEKVDIRQTLEETFLSFKILAEKRSLQYKLILPPEQVEAMADKDALQKIFGNLISNAVKYARNSVTVTLLPADTHSHTFRIEFENDGALIPEALKEKVFDPFFRIRETNHQKGTGIGLTIARSLTALHKGQLLMDFAKKEVNLFVLILPYNNAS